MTLVFIRVGAPNPGRGRLLCENEPGIKTQNDLHVQSLVPPWRRILSLVPFHPIDVPR